MNARALLTMIERGVVRVLNEASKMRSLQVSVRYGDEREEVEHFEPYGFTSRPPAGSEVITVKIGGDGAHTVALCAAYRAGRPTDLTATDVCMWDADGQRITLAAGTTIQIKADTAVEIGTGGALAAANGVVTGLGVDPFTGQTYHALGNTSGKVRAEV